MVVRLIAPQDPSWNAEVERLHARLEAAASHTLFPAHFLQVVLPRIGGRLALFAQDQTPAAAGFLFPRLPSPVALGSSPAYTLRLHPLLNGSPVDLSQVQQNLAEALAAPVVLYDPLGDLHFAPTHELVHGIELGRPDRDEAAAVRIMQQQVWGSPPEALYPADIHSSEFGLGTSLVARLQGRPVGFLFGFVKFGGDQLPADWNRRYNGELRIESQTLGVLPEHRGARLGFLLKKVQARDALRSAIGVINWTVDPLQWPNALLNFGLLRAVACEFTPDYYPFRNELNRVPASRFSLTWLVHTERVASACGLRIPTSSEFRPAAQVLDLARERGIERVNEAAQMLVASPMAERIAIELPADWTVLQRDNLNAAQQWRTTTDALFQRLIGQEDGQYVVTDVGLDGPRRYLVAQRACDELWAQLGESSTYGTIDDRRWTIDDTQ